MWDHRSYYVLGEVFWRTGHAIYGDVWTGYETSYRPAVGLAELRHQLKIAARSFEQHLDHAKFLQSHYPENATEDQFRAHQRDIKTAEIASAQARAKRDHLSRTLRVPEENQENYDRSENVQQRLIKAFSHGELDLIFGTGAIVCWDEWAKYATFRVSFPQSLIYAPSDMSRIRRDSGFVERKSFDRWLDSALSIEVRLAKREGPEQLLKMQKWFGDWVTANNTKPSKEDSEQQFLRVFNPKGKTTFADLWSGYAPDYWKRRGRPKS